MAKRAEQQSRNHGGPRSLEVEHQTDLLMTRRAALETAREAVEEGDVKAALKVLELVSRLDLRVRGSVDPDELRKDAIIEAADRRDRLCRRFGRALAELLQLMQTEGLEAAGEEVLALLEDAGVTPSPEEEPGEEE